MRHFGFAYGVYHSQIYRLTNRLTQEDGDSSVKKTDCEECDWISFPNRGRVYFCGHRDCVCCKGYPVTAVSPRLSRPERELDHTPLCSAKVKKVNRFISVPLYICLECCYALGLAIVSAPNKWRGYSRKFPLLWNLNFVPLATYSCPWLLSSHDPIHFPLLIPSDLELLLSPLLSYYKCPNCINSAPKFCSPLYFSLLGFVPRPPTSSINSPTQIMQIMGHFIM